MKREGLGYVSRQDTNTTLIDEPVPLLESHGPELEKKLSPVLRKVPDTPVKEDLYKTDTPKSASVDKPSAWTFPSTLETKTNVPTTPLKVEVQAPKITEVTAPPTPEDKEQELSSLLDFAMFDNMVTIPDMGTFKRKLHFSPLATPTSIEQALRRRTLPLSHFK
jgi:hypothetical protein